MPDDLYGDEPTATAEGPPRDERPRPGDEGGEGDEREQDRGETALVPKSLFGGKELTRGDRYEIEIAAIHDEEISILLLDETPKPEDSEEPVPEEPRRPTGSVGAMFE